MGRNQIVADIEEAKARLGYPVEDECEVRPGDTESESRVAHSDIAETETSVAEG